MPPPSSPPWASSDDPSFDPSAIPSATPSPSSPTPAGSRAFAGRPTPSGCTGSSAASGRCWPRRPSPRRASRNGYFLYQSLTTPVLLAAGGDYVLAGVTGPTDPYVFDVQDSNGNAALTTNGITYVQDRYDVSSTLTLPTQTDANAPSPSTPGFFGPNFLSAPVPEASTTVSLGLLLVLGFLGATARRRVSDK